MDFEESEMFEETNSAIEAFPIMEEIRRQGKLCDISLVVDGHTVTAHRIVLAATIPYFRAMFTHDMAESRQREVTIKGIEPSVLEHLVNFAYSSKIVLTTENVQSLLIGASFLQLHNVRSACCAFLEKRLRSNNVLGVRQFADTLSCSMLVDAANKYIEKYFMIVAPTDEFLTLSFNEVYEIVGRDELYVDSEEQVFEAVMAWIKRNVSERQEYLPQLLTRVRMPLLSPQYLTDHVFTEELVRTSHRCRDLLDEAKDYYLMPERRPLLQSFRARPRCCNDIVGMIYAVGGLTKTGDSMSTVEVFDPIVGRWQVAEAMMMLRSRVGVAVMHNLMYAIGGYNGQKRLSTVEVFDPTTNTWTKVASMNCKRSAVGAAALDNRLYVCGGYDGVCSLNTVECYNPDKNEWTMVTNMSKHRSAAGVIAFDRHVYALGGHDGLSIFDSVEKYSPESGQWLPVIPMLSKRCRLGVATLHGRLFVCGGYDGASFLRTAETYDPVTRQWTQVAPLSLIHI